MPERIVVVEESFIAKGREILVTPKITLTRPAMGKRAVQLRLPDGSERTATASFDVAHVRGPQAPFAMVRIHDVAPADVPAGTEIWTMD